MRWIVIAAATVLCGFALPSDAITQGMGNQKNDPARLPFDGSTGFLNGYSLRVPRNGDFLWNGAPVGQAMLKTYLRQWAALPRNAGRLFVAFEQGLRSVVRNGSAGKSLTAAFVSNAVVRRLAGQ